MTRCRSAAAVLAAVLLTSGLARAASPARVTTMRLTSEADVAAPPEAVWHWITNGKNLVTWCPAWKSDANAKLQIRKVGDVLDYSDPWGNGGRSIVTYVKDGRELRVAHEPDNGSYMCQSKFLVSPAAAGTHVTWIEQYTEEQLADVADKNAADVQTQMSATLDALKAGVEGAKK